MLGGGANRLGGRRPKGRTTMMMMPSSGQAVEFALGLEETVRDNDDRCCEEGKCCLEWSDLEEEEEEEEGGGEWRMLSIGASYPGQPNYDNGAGGRSRAHTWLH